MRLPAVFAYAAVRRRRGRRGIAVDLSHDYFFTLILKYSKKPCKRSICKAFLLSRKRGIRVKVARFSLDIKAFFTGWGTKEICTVLYQCYRADMVEARRVEVPQAALRAHGCPHSLPPCGRNRSGMTRSSTLPQITKGLPARGSLLLLVEARRVELLSENASAGTSPGADGCSGRAVSLYAASAVIHRVSVASLCMACAKLDTLTFTTKRRSVRSRGPLRQNGQA